MLDEELVVAVLGVSLALSVLLEDYTEPGWLPATVDEQHVPLNSLFAQLPSFCFTEHYRGVVPICLMRQFVSLLVQRLRMHVGELVMAYALVESVLRNFPTTMRVNSVRPLLLGACFIACKTARDEDLELCQCYESLCDVLDVDLALLSRIEHQMLELLHWRVPMGPIYQTYANAIFDSASRHLGRTVAAPNVLHALVLEEGTAHAVTVDAAVQSCAREVPQCAALARSCDRGIPTCTAVTTTQHDLS